MTITETPVADVGTIRSAVAALTSNGQRPTVNRLAVELGVDPFQLARHTTRLWWSAQALRQLSASPFAAHHEPEIGLSPGDIVPEGI